MDLNDVETALKFTDWSNLLHVETGTTFAIKLNGEATLATVLANEDKEDDDYDRNLAVVVEVQGRFFRKTGWAQIGSHCYGEYEPSWGELKEVTAVPRYVTDWVEL